MSSSEPSPPEDVQKRLVLARRNCFLCAGAFVAGAVGQPLLFDTVSVPVVAVQLCGGAAFFVLGWLLGSGRIGLNGVGAMVCLVSIAALTCTVLWTGGIQSPAFAVFYSLPLIITVFTPGRRLPMVLSILLSMGGLMLVSVRDQATAEQQGSYAFTYAFTALVAAYGAQTYRRLILAGQRSQEDRLRALQQLAESEHRRELAERNRADLERLVLVGQLASRVAHEVNNPLAFVKSNLRYLQDEFGPHPGLPHRDEFHEVLGEAQQGVERIQQIVTDLREFARQDAVHEACSVEEALDEAQRLVSARLPSLGAVVSEVSLGLPRVRLSQRHLVQVLLNLLVNAAEAAESVQPRRSPRIVLRASRSTAGVRLEVEDNGPGISPQALEHLFEPSFHLKPLGPGTKLGLALCREYAVRSGGTLVAENLPEGGARFTLELAAA
ncbi:sensor histidine kinase [Stigmatella erecta]|uniref:histidine kinase n=1 Tax=Stigmatella erecta TaxID=83460 RepID=A0A1I0I6B6_9BACT|nr:ATP-binding protein [Stigmatella erecta]SET91267.1 His Kinase A (phospho-acceptor) domain-containing protein [Stigmatella erecta]